MIALFAVLSLATPPSDPPIAKGRLDAACGGEIAKIKGADRVRFTPLGALPDAHLEIAVNRRVGGCPAPLIVRYDVSK